MNSLERPQVSDIVITHFVNPHEFWYKHETNTINEKLYDLETRIQGYFINKQRETNFNIPYIPKINEVVAVFNLSENRWIRAVVDHVYEFHNEENKYILWAMDYGKPLMSSVKFIRQIPEACSNYDVDAVFFGGLHDILPAEKTFDFKSNSSKIVVKNKWSEKSINTCEEIMNRSYTCSFHIGKNYKGQNFGELIITTDMNNELNIKNVLVEVNDGILISENFYKVLDEYQLNKSSRWLQPNGNCNLFKYNQNIENMQIRKTMPPLQIENLSNLEKSVQLKPSLQQQEKISALVVNNENTLTTCKISHEISIENQAEISEKVKFWQEKNEQQSNKTNDITSVDNDLISSYDNIDSISNAGNTEIFNKCNVEKNKMEYIKSYNVEEINYPEKRIGVTYDNLKLIEKLKICVPPRDNDSTIVPGFHLAEDPHQLKAFVNTTSSDDKKSIVSSDSDLSAVKSKRLTEMRKRYNKNISKQQNEETKAIQLPAGYDMRQLNAKKNDPTISSSSSSDLVIKRKENNQIPITIKNRMEARSSKPPGSKVSNTLNEPQKLHNSEINYKSLQSNDRIPKFGNCQKRIQVDSTLHNVNEVCVPTCSIGKDSVLVHGEITKPIDKMTEAKFTSNIYTEMELLRITKIYRIQQYAWPHLARLNSLILVNSERTGKTYSYLPIICSLINMQKDDGEILDGIGPIGIIIVPFRSEAEKLLDQCRRFTKKNVLCTGERNKAVAIGDLQSNADLLITTPEGINLLMNNELKCFSRKRMKHLIIENLNLWKEQNHKILKEAFGRFKSNVQVVVTSQIWDPAMEKLLISKSLNNPLLCIGAHIEAAIYAKINFKLKIIPKKFKVQAILDFINKHDYRDEKLLILCNNDHDVEEVSTNLRNIGHFIQSCTNRLQADDIREITRQWNNNSNRENFILITTDESLVQLRIQNAQNLIHYTLSTSWTRTCFRFSVFLKYYSDRLKEETVTNQRQANTLILLDEDNNEHLPKLVNFLERNNSQINSNIKKLAKTIEHARETKKNSKNRPLCEKWLEFHKIHDKTKCDKRHLITEVDAPPTDFPSKGWVEIQIINCESPIRYCVRLLKHKIDNNWKILRQSDKYVKFNFEFTKYFSNSDNHELYIPILNGTCCVKEHEKYDRGRIIEITKIKSEIIKVYIKLIDRGKFKTFRGDQLLFLPDKFKEFPPQAVDLYLTNVFPYDEEEIWGKKSTDAIKHWLEIYKKDHRILAYINFSLSEIIYADEIVIQKCLDSLKTYNDKLYIKKNIILKEFVKKMNDDDIDLNEITIQAKKILDNQKSETSGSINTSTNNGNISDSESIGKDEQKITQLSNSSTTSYPSSGEITMNMMRHPPSTIQRARPRPRTKNQHNNIRELKQNSINNLTVRESWNMLNENDYSKISIGCFYSPFNFYVEILHDVKKLKSLYKKINDFIDNGAKSVQNPVIGSSCLAEINGIYNRCKITSLNCDSNGMVANVFFCDIGSTRNCKITELRTTNSEIINALPYQAIHCSLIGISPKNMNGFWTDNDSNDIYNKIDSQSLYARPKTNAKQNNDTILNYWKYEIILVNCSTDEDVQINKQIVKLGYAIKDPDTAHHLDFVYDAEYSSNTDEEEWQDDPNAKTFKYQSLDTQNENSKTDDNNNFMDCDINFTNDEILEFFNLPPTTKFLPPEDEINVSEPILQSNLPPTAKILPQEDELNLSEPITEDIKNEVDNNPKIKIKIKNTTNTQNHNKEIMQLAKLNDIPKLISLYKIPTVVWQQSEDLICLKISAPDIKDYILHVTNSNLIFAAAIDGETNILNINLFGLIDETLVSHELRGLNVIVRLLKKITGKRYSWPRLCTETDKHKWLKYNFNAIIMEHEKFENLVQPPEASIAYESDSDSEFTENIDYETYNKIDNPENVYDVLEDN